MSSPEKLVKLEKWGNGMEVLIPSAFANQLKVSPGDQMRIVLNGQNLLITPVKKRSHWQKGLPSTTDRSS